MARSENSRQYRPSSLEADVLVVDGDHPEMLPDRLAVEEPLEIRVLSSEGDRAVAVTMRTPGADEELAVGFLYCEGVICSRGDILGFEAPITASTAGSIVKVRLRPGLEPDLAPLERHFTTTSACGLCGKAGLDALLLGREPNLPEGPRTSPQLLYQLPETLSEAQSVFAHTGGLHAAALFDTRGNLLEAREDVGRHNALDKLIGWAFLQERLPLHEGILMVSGRSSYELVQKTLMAQAPILCSVSAPSSAAVSMARRYRLTLVGFLRERRLNVYSMPERLGLSP